MGAQPERVGRSARRRIANRWQRIEWPVVWALTVASVVLGIVGFAVHAEGAGRSPTFLDLLYRSLQLFVLESGAVDGDVPWTLELARYLAPLVAIYTATKALLLLFADQLRLLRIGRLRGHVIIAGAGRTGLALARALRERGSRVIVVDQNTGDDTRAACRQCGAPVLDGDATEPAVLRRAGLHRADRLIAVTGDDGANAQIAVAAREEVTGNRGHRGPLTCFIHVFDLELFRLLATPWLAGIYDGDFRIEFINVFDRGARSMLQQHPPFVPGDPTPRLLVAGVGRFGESLIVQAARRWRDATGQGPLPILVVDREATTRCETLRLRYPELTAWCELEPRDLDVHSPEFERGEFLFDAVGRPAVSIVYVCFDDDLRSLAAALALYDRLEGAAVPVVARMEHDAGLAALPRAASAAGAGFEGLHAFGLRDRTWTPKVVLEGSLESMARALHGRYLYHRLAAGESPGARPGLVEWDALPGDLKEANLRQALGLRTVLSSAGFSIVPQRGWQDERTTFDEDEVDRLAQLEHERWVAERTAAGWRFAPARNDEKRRHPNLVPWEKLPENVRDIDRDVIRNLPALATGAGYAIVQQQSARPVTAGGK